ncbi:uncharacterized protein DS421_3g83480 [Arachis hypogaea]|uniref:Uncharacterized protein n=1 Tax=Arachis hypogaea TaxID=3818 RepID=A0A445DW21_ARAHY|nr:uncharacterized protein DS421_3g83480 [Arachis hypogaea]RYR67376.1 hypothetical protein Ahy_A03g013710 isoform C [Arachis hypogaea]
MAISPFQFPETILHPQQFTTEPPKPPTAPDSRNHPSKQFTTKPPTATHSSDDVEGRNHHPILLLAEPASSFAVVERPRHRVLTRRRWNDESLRESIKRREHFLSFCSFLLCLYCLTKIG